MRLGHIACIGCQGSAYLLLFDAPYAPWEPAGMSGGLISGPTSTVPGASAQDTVIRHRKVGRPSVGVLARGARIRVLIHK